MNICFPALVVPVTTVKSFQSQSAKDTVLIKTRVDNKGDVLFLVTGKEM